VVKVSFSPIDFKRRVSGSEGLTLKNRYFEKNPFLTDDGSALLARPGMKVFCKVGEGPIRGIFSEPGAFNGDLFVVSYDSLYRVDTLGNSTYITNGLNSPNIGIVKMAITASIGTTPEYMFLADGRNLYVYIDNSYAKGFLSGNPSNNDIVVIGTTYYKFTTGSLETGTPDGSSGNPWLINLDITEQLAYQHLFDAINASGVAGTDYSSALTSENPVAKAYNLASTSVSVRSTLIGALGNSTATTVTSSGMAWTNTTLTGGGSPSINQVQLPDDVGCIDVAVINSFVIVLPVQSGGINGRFYWIKPGETTIDPLDFATAEQRPDPAYSICVLGDQFYLPGGSTTEVWYMTGNLDTPVERLQGVMFDRGTWESTAIAIKEALMLCDADGGVFIIREGIPQRISTPSIEEEIREAIQTQQNRVY
jgi:hypothetical protein